MDKSWNHTNSGDQLPSNLQERNEECSYDKKNKALDSHDTHAIYYCLAYLYEIIHTNYKQIMPYLMAEMNKNNYENLSLSQANNSHYTKYSLASKQHPYKPIDCKFSTKTDTSSYTLNRLKDTYYIDTTIF